MTETSFDAEDEANTLKLNELKSEIAAATNVRDLRKLLIEYDDLRKEITGANKVVRLKKNVGNRYVPVIILRRN